MLLYLELLVSLKSLWYGIFCVLISIYKLIFVAVVYFSSDIPTLCFISSINTGKKPLNDFQAIPGNL